MHKRNPISPRASAALKALSEQSSSEDAIQTLLALARIEDPVTRYMVSMLVDRIADIASGGPLGPAAKLN